jgi:hypothetical protein
MRMRRVSALRTGIGERGDGVMLGEPVAREAQLIGAAREGEGFFDGPPRAEPADHRRLVKD